MKKIAASIVLGFIAFAPIFASAQSTGDTGTSTNGCIDVGGQQVCQGSSQYTYARDGIFDCNQNGSAAMSVGATSAIGGVYVPVADAAVELNTGTLVYKECVLREVVDREREAAMSSLLKLATNNIMTGRNGNPQFVQNVDIELVLNASNPAISQLMQSSGIQNLNPTFASDVKTAIANTYETEILAPTNVLKCPIQGDVTALETGQPGSFNWVDFYSESDPACTALSAAGLTQSLVDNAISRANANLAQQWTWGAGFYPRVDANGNVITPASVVANSYEAILQSPIAQLQSANDIGQMIGPLYAGVTTQVIGGSGLSGITQSMGGQPSYLDQIVAESSQGLQNASTNVGLTNLQSWLQAEQQFHDAAVAIGNLLLQTQQGLRSAENACWQNITTQTCTGTPTLQNGTYTCTDSTGATLTIATSTAFSQAIISSQITPLVASTTSDIQKSQNALQLIANIQAGLTSSSSQAAQQAALQELDTLVANHQIQTSTDAQNESILKTTLTSSLTTLLTNTGNLWGGNTGQTDNYGNPINVAWDGTVPPTGSGTGWCNVNNPTTVSEWTQVWTQ